MDQDALEVIKKVAVENSKEIYADGMKPAIREAGGALEAVVGLFNNVVLYPVKMANITFKYKLECFEKDLKEKIDKIPKKRLKQPSLMIAGPTLEALRYTYDEKEIREMYVNLLASAMDSENDNAVHPSFVDTIRQMNPLDARVFKRIAKDIQYRCARIWFHINGTTKMRSYAMPDYFVEELVDLADPFDISNSIENLNRLGLIWLTDKSVSDMSYASLINHEYVKKRFEMYDDVSINSEQFAVRTKIYGKVFANICMEI